MREFDWDLIRGGHYGQRSCEPHLQAEHMAAPTNAANVKKVLANSEPSTHGTKQASRRLARIIFSAACAGALVPLEARGRRLPIRRPLQGIWIDVPRTPSSPNRT